MTDDAVRQVLDVMIAAARELRRCTLELDAARQTLTDAHADVARAEHAESVAASTYRDARAALDAFVWDVAEGAEVL